MITASLVPNPVLFSTIRSLAGALLVTLAIMPAAKAQGVPPAKPTPPETPGSASAPAGSPAPNASLASSPDADRPQENGPLSVQQAIQLGLRFNPAVRAAQAAAGAAHDKTRAVNAMRMPQLSINTYLSTGNMPGGLSTAPDVTPVNRLTVPGKSSVDQNLMLMAPLYTGGRLESLVHAASQEERAALAYVGVRQVSTALAIRDAYYRALLADALVQVARTRVQADAEMVRNAQALFESGKGIHAQLARAEAEAADAQQALTREQNNRDKTLLDLSAAMGVRLDSKFTLADKLAYAAPFGDLNSSLSAAERNRPELIAARARVEAAKAGIGAAEGSLCPQVYGAAMADAFAPEQMDRSTGGTVGAIISFPLFDAGQRRAEVGQAKALRESASDDLQEADLEVAKDVRQAWLDIDTADQNYHTAQTALEAAQEAYNVTALRVENQKGIQVELLDAITALTQAQTNLDQALYDHSIAAARLQRAVGEI
ncbi:MAG TPA: TolC family protein [Armatimonadota bacterium]|nr:TolC family protein [Armatimonadota bacterium]